MLRPWPVIAALILSLASAAAAQVGGAPIWRVFTRADGLAANDVRNLYEDSEGGVWFSTPAGVTRFDGLWQTLTVREGLVSNDVRGVVEEAPGRVWVGTDVGLDRLTQGADGTWVVDLSVNDATPTGVTALVAGRDGTAVALWAGVDDGLYRLSANGWDRYAPLAGVSIRLLATDTDGRVWGVADGAADDAPSLWHVPRFDLEPNRFALPAAAETAGDMLPLGAGWWWVGTEQGVLNFDGLWSETDIPPGSPPVRALSRRDTGGAIWAGTDVGLFRFAGGWRLFDADDGLPADAIQDVLIDSSERLWVATSSGVAMDDGGWAAFAAPSVTALAADLLGTLWVGTSAGLSRLVGGQLTPADGSVPREVIPAAAVSQDGGVWVGSAGSRGGIARRVDGVWESVPLPTGADRVYAIAFDSSGRPWVGTGFLELDPESDAVRVDFLGAASVFDGEAWQTWRLPATPVSLAEDADGSMWAATRTRGVVRVGDATYADPAPPPSDARAVLADTARRLWLGTAQGLFRREDGVWLDTPIPRASAPNAVWAIFEDNSGFIWVGLDDGMARLDPSGQWTLFDVSDGLPASGVGAIAQTDGDLWFAGRRGEGLLRRSLGRAFPQTRLVAPPRGAIGESVIRLEFVGGDARTPEDRLRFAYRVNDGPWSAPKTGTSEVIGDLPNGSEAEIQVRAVDRDGRADPTPATTVVRVDSTPPRAEITEPGAGDAVRGVVVIRGSASDETDFAGYVLDIPGAGPVESGDPVVDGALAEWNTDGLADGSYTLRLVVRDAVEGPYDTAHEELREVTVTVDNTPPLAGVGVPSGKVSGRVAMTVAVSDAALANWALEYARADLSGALVWTTLRESDTSATSVAEPFEWDASALDGPTTVRVRALDRAGNADEATASVQLDNPGARPVVNISDPLEGAVVGGSVRIGGTISDATLVSYTVRVEPADGPMAPLGEGAEAVDESLILAWDTGGDAFPDGVYVIVIDAVDDNGNQSTARVRVTVDNASPTVEITEPEPNTLLAAGQDVTIRAAVTDVHATTYTVLYTDPLLPDDPVVIAEGDVSAGAVVAVWRPDATVTRPFLRVVVTDAAGNNRTSDPVAVRVDAADPTVSVDEPAEGAIVTGSVVIRGAVSDENFQEGREAYTAWYRVGSGRWLPIPTVGVPVGVLAVWDTPVTDGPATLRIASADAVGFETEVTVGVRLDNVDPEADITLPAAGAQVAGVVDIAGTATDEHFTSYSVEWSPLVDGSPILWTPIARDVAGAVVDGRLATWDTGNAEGPVRVRLVVGDAAGHAAVAERSIVVARASPSDRHAILSATDGGVRLRLPPNALPESAFVTVNDVSAESVMGRPPLRAVRIDPEGVALDARKPGTLEFQLPADHSSAAVGVAEWDAGAEAWRYLGGSVDADAGWVRTRVFRLGRYALIPEPASPTASGAGLRLRCQPRAFSPLGGELPQEAFVTFSLREDARVRIRVYNQAGRLARRLPDTQARSGEHAVPWDGRDDMGRALPNGAYVVQVDAGYAREQQVVLIWNR